MTNELKKSASNQNCKDRIVEDSAHGFLHVSFRKQSWRACPPQVCAEGEQLSTRQLCQQATLKVVLLLQVNVSGTVKHFLLSPIL